MDEELRQLCKKVYERTGWLVNDRSPEYTSDYLLEKLPFPSELGRDSFAWIGKWEQGAGSAPKRQVWERANTPLKALLKLTIALSEAGELDNE